MLHGVFRGNSLSVVVSKHVVQEVKSFIRDKRLVLVVHKFAPWLLWVLSKDVIVVTIQGYIVLFDVGEKIIGSQNFCDLDELIIVVFSLEEWLLLEDHSCEHAT